MTTDPTITDLNEAYSGCRCYRVAGAPEPGSGWTVREGRDPWCESTVSDDGYVLSFRGEVWPGAWPSLFEVGPRTVYGQTTRVRDRERFDAIVAHEEG